MTIKKPFLVRERLWAISISWFFYKSIRI